MCFNVFRCVLVRVCMCIIIIKKQLHFVFIVWFQVVLRQRIFGTILVECIKYILIVYFKRLSLSLSSHYVLLKKNKHRRDVFRELCIIIVGVIINFCYRARAFPSSPSIIQKNSFQILAVINIFQFRFWCFKYGWWKKKKKRSSRAGPV